MKVFLIKLILFVSSYFPMSIILLIVNFDSINSKNELMQPRIFVFLIIIFLIIFISIISLKLLAKSSNGTKRLKLVNVERPDDSLINYMMTYVISLATMNDLNNTYQLLANLFIFLLIGYLYIKLNLLYFNPLWALAGFVPYKVNDDTILITNCKMDELRRKSKDNEEIAGFYIINGIFIAKNN